jgi:hypothetical protein
MITKLSIANFKSIRQLDLDCKKINLFIGEPNTGKSNILEALGLLSWAARATHTGLGQYVRVQLTQNLFYDQLLDQEVKISLSGKPTMDFYVRFRDNDFEFRSLPMPGPFGTMDYNGSFSGGENGWAVDIKFFRFRSLPKYDDKEPGSLKPPDGTNLFSVVFSSKSLRETMAEFFRKYGLKLVLKPQEKVFELQKQTDDLVFSFPYALTSDTLQRIIFYTVAMVSDRPGRD